MREALLRAGATCVALALVLLSTPPAPAAAPDDNQRAVEMLSQGCGASTRIAQAEPSASPEASAAPSASPSASPSATPSPYVGTPNSPNGPTILVPAPPATATPSVTPPPAPTPTPAAKTGSPPPVYITPVTPAPSSTPVPAPTYSAGPVVSASPTPASSATPSPAETLGPNDYAILGDKLTGKNAPGEPQDLDGHVNIIYQQGTLVGDHAHYDGHRYIDVTGNAFIKDNTNDTIFYADAVRFDTQTQRATLINGRGESTQGVEQGKLHFSAKSMVTQANGVTHGERAYLTTCENPRGGYHVESKTLDVYPGNKAVAKSATLFLGALAIFYIPVLVISLRQDQQGSRRNPGFIPVVGYSAAEGFYVKARLGFSPSDTYYGYYRVEEYTKIGLGLGYVGTIKRKDGKRQTDIDYFRQNNKATQSANDNLHLNDQENFSRSTRGTFGFNYTGNYGPLVSLPPQYDISGAVDHGDAKGNRQNYNYHRTETAGQSFTDNYGIVDHTVFNPKFQNDVTMSFTTNQFSGGLGSAIASHTTHLQTLTQLSGKALDYSLTFDGYDASTPSYLEKEPELEIRPHGPLFPHLRGLPVTGDFFLGEYNDQIAPKTTSRGEGKITMGPALAHFLNSDFSAQVILDQDAYGTGDLKAQIGQQATLTTSLWGHMVNTVSYTDSHVNGPLAEPFKSLDVLGNATKQGNDNLRLFNNDIYTLSLTASTFFNRQAQAVGYQLTARPSPRSTVLIGGSFNPGPGQGFYQTSLQFATPFGYKSDLQFSTFVDWKNKGRLNSKNIYYRHVVGDCYEIRLSYNQDIKQVNLSVDLLAFPSHPVNFGIGQNNSLGSVIPQNFVFGQ